jgi:dipeptidyl aminopeptidase/acylaminoacyl peptidase
MMAGLAQPALIPRAALFQDKDIFDVRLSPDGERVYYQRRAEREGRLFYRELRRPGREQSLDCQAALLNWTPAHGGGIVAAVEKQGRRLLYLEGRQQRAVPLFPYRQLRIEALSPLRPDELAAVIVAEQDHLSGLYLIDFRRGTWQKIGPLPGFQKLCFDQQLRPRAARQINDLGGYSIFRHDGAGWHETRRYPFDESQFSGGFQDVLSVSADGRTFYVTDNLQRDKTALLAVDVASGQPELLVADGKADILPFNPIIGPDGRPHMVVSSFAEARRHFLDARTQDDFGYANRLLRGEAAFAEASADGSKWLLRRLNGGPMVYYLFDRASRQLTRLFSDVDALDAYELASRRAFSVIARDGRELPVHLYLPPGTPTDERGLPLEPLPTVLYAHGGPWMGVVHWNEWKVTRCLQLLANRGYAVINTEFRGSTGLGKHFTDLGDRQWGDAMLHDKLDIAAWAVQQGIAPAERLGIWGWSYGGYAASAALAFAPEQFACGIAMYAPLELESFSRLPASDSEIWRRRVGDPYTAEGVELLRRHSPFFAADRIQRPLLLTTGGKDARVPQQQSSDFARALVAAGKEVLYFYYPEEGHDYRQPGSWVSFWALAEQFLHQHLGGRFEPLGDSLKQGDFKIARGEAWVKRLK